jgi:hypothetical protein
MAPWGGRSAFLAQDDLMKPMPLGPGRAERPEFEAESAKRRTPERKPAQKIRPEDEVREAERAEKREDRICEMLKKFSEERPENDDESDARSRIFWSFVRHHAQRTGQLEDAVTATIHSRCPDMALPPKPPAPIPGKPPEHEGFHGKIKLSLAEAKELSDLLTVVLTPLTPEEAAKELAREECLRNIVRADGFPIVERLQEKLKDFIVTAAPTDTFEISHGEAVVTGHAVECAEAIGRVKVIRTITYAGGAAAGGAGLLWLVGLI